MNKLINNAKEQMDQFGFIRMTYYYDRSYQRSEELTFTSLDNAIAEIKEILFNGKDDDIHVPNPSYF